MLWLVVAFEIKVYECSFYFWKFFDLYLQGFSDHVGFFQRQIFWKFNINLWIEGRTVYLKVSSDIYAADLRKYKLSLLWTNNTDKYINIKPLLRGVDTTLTSSLLFFFKILNYSCLRCERIILKPIWGQDFE